MDCVRCQGHELSLAQIAEVTGYFVVLGLQVETERAELVVSLVAVAAAETVAITPIVVCGDPELGGGLGACKQQRNF